MRLASTAPATTLHHTPPRPAPCKDARAGSRALEQQQQRAAGRPACPIQERGGGGDSRRGRGEGGGHFPCRVRVTTLAARRPAGRSSSMASPAQGPIIIGLEAPARLQHGSSKTPARLQQSSRMAQARLASRLGPCGTLSDMIVHMLKHGRLRIVVTFIELYVVFLKVFCWCATCWCDHTHELPDPMHCQCIMRMGEQCCSAARFTCRAWHSMGWRGSHADISSAARLWRRTSHRASHCQIKSPCPLPLPHPRKVPSAVPE